MKLLAAILLLALGGCPSGDDCQPGWKAVFSQAELDRPILALWGAGDEVWAVGGPLGAPGLEALAMRYDGSDWKRLPTGHSETLWWVWGTDDRKVVWMVGEHGLILRWDGKAFQTLAKMTDATLFGVWGSGPNDVWVVGGTPGGGAGEDDVAFHWNGQELTADAPPARGAAFFKVWGSGKDDVWVVGEGGTIWQHTAAGWQPHDGVTRDSLTTVHGCGPSEIYAVGANHVYRWDGGGWSRDDAAMALAGVNGVHCGRDQVLAVGNGGLKLRFDRSTSTWIDDTFEEPFYSDFHGAWISPSGVLWAAGGNYNAPAASGRYGMLGVLGCPLPR